MKKNPLEEIYSSQVLLNEETGKTSNVVVPAGKQEIAKGGKVGLASGHALEKVKDVEDPEEAEGTKILTGEPKKLNDSMETPTKSFEGSFEKLFKATINEEMGEEPVVDMEVEIPTSNEEMVDELEDNKDEVSDLVSDLKAVMDHLQNILDKISEEGEAEEAEFGDEGEESSETEEEAVKEATELKPVGKAGHSLMGKANKVGSIKAKGGKAQGGDIESDPELKPAKAFDKSLQNPKSHAVKSTVQKGEFFK